MGNRRKPKNKRFRLTKEQIVNIPTDEKVLLKVVPAMADGVHVGEAHLYDDGSVEMVYTNPEAAKQAQLKIQEAIAEVNSENGTDYSPANLGLDI